MTKKRRTRRSEFERMRSPKRAAIVLRGIKNLENLQRRMKTK